MRILVCGVGSVGERHIGNLLHLGYEDIAVYRTTQRAFRTLRRQFRIFTELNAALAEFRPEVALITNPTSLHLPTAMQCADKGCHLFIEKPVSHQLERLSDLQALLDRNHRVAMVGYMLRFHPLFQRVKELLGEGQKGPLGLPLFVRSSWGEHVPDWHPWEDYRQSYAVRQELGGGPALTLSHDLDLLVWMFGSPQEVLKMSNRHAPLASDCDHAVDFLLRFENGVTANVHLDYCQRPASRSWELVGTRGRLQLDPLGGTMTLWKNEIGRMSGGATAETPASDVFRVPPAFERNQLFIDEIRYFLECLKSGRQPAPGLAEAAESVRIALA